MTETSIESTSVQKTGTGLRAKLFIAVGAITLTTVVAAGISAISFSRISEQATLIGEVTLSELETARLVGSLAPALESGAASLIASRTNDERTERFTKLHDDLEALRSLLETAMAGEGAVQETLTALDGNLAAIDATVTRRTDLQVQAAQTFDEIAASRGALEAVFVPYREEVEGSVTETFNKMLTDPETVLINLFPLYGAYGKTKVVQSVQTFSDQIMTLTVRVATAPSLAQLDAAAAEAADLLRWALDTKSALNSDFSDQARKVSEAFKAFYELLGNENGLASQRREIFKLELDLQFLLTENETLVAQLDDLTGRIAQQATQGGRDAVGNVGSAISVSLIWLIAVSIASVILAIGIGYFLVDQAVVQRLLTLSAAMSKIAAGDLKSRFDVTGRDEIADMGQTLETFRENAEKMDVLRAEQAEAEKEAERLRRASLDKLADDFNSRVSSIVSTVGKSVTGLTDRVEGMARESEQSADQAKSASGSSQLTADRIASVSQTAEDLSESMSEMNDRTAETSKVSNGVARDAERTDAAVESLSNAAAKIGDVVALISDIAEQTNLLALNATIEAARAGEAGKGFAVVANEVKSLATQTGAATGDIVAQVDAIKQAVREAADTTRLVTDGIGKVDRLVTAIAEASEKQFEATNAINQTLHSATTEIGAMNGQVGSIMDSTGRIQSAASDLVTGVGDVRTCTQDLTAELDRFVEDIHSDGSQAA